MRKFAVVSCVGLLAGSAQACDLCAVYTANEAKESRAGFSVGVFEQFTHFSTVQENGKEVDNEVDQSLDSSITQILIGYRFTHRFGLQLNVPYIVRSFRRPEPTSPTTFKVERGTENGLGDVSLVANVRAYERMTEDTTLVLSLLGGVKFPTGQSDRLREELNEIEVPGAPESGIHGHDLALGSGSFDGIVGAAVFGSWNRWFTTASIQYAIRSEGAIGYRYANDLTWNGGPGFYLWLSHGRTLSLQFNVSGESKGLDTRNGESAKDTGITSV